MSEPDSERLATAKAALAEAQAEHDAAIAATVSSSSPAVLALTVFADERPW